MNFEALPAPKPCMLWQVDLDREPDLRDLAMLSDDEWAHARRFAFERDRRRFLAAHAALRHLLAQHTDLPGASLRFVQGPFGKPELHGNAAGVHFNLSHSGPLALVALHPAASIGVDVETMRHMPDAALLAESHFTQDECDALARLHGEARDRAFLYCWTRKEACLKAVGLGVGLDTRCFHVGIEPDARTVWLPATVGSQRIALSSFALGTTALGAVATAYRHGAPAVHSTLDTELCV
jgi:4'-phosphopantetheinyl transferase